MRVPVRVEDDHGVCRLQIEPQPSGSRRQKEDEGIRVRVVELLEHVGALVGLGHPVQPEELEALVVEVVLDDGHALRHLAEHEDAVASPSA